ncbi:hypothetical protein BJ878DRAFT_289365 [Calycina marina]|uniref:DUF3074 domain-containing protein n=1 Tax=Calycina marina TaxID=1763456 RepID=A0A9P7Z6A1_9HELO|nr:hypothetical protein BJ878DRAFT_289365 [Calycina marina]
MAALHEALRTLGPTEFSATLIDDLKPFLTSAFSAGQLIIDSVPIAAASGSTETPEGRSRAASNVSEIEISPARASAPPADVLALQKEWKGLKLAENDNPLGMSVYRLGAKDGRGAWFARRSVHEGLGFKKWKRALEREFPETMKGGNAPGEGNIRGIGGERRVEYKIVDGVGKMEVYQLSAQFAGPTTPRDFVTMYLTSGSALEDQGEGVPRHFMVISKPCDHPDAKPRAGYIRGSYESVEFIREIPLKKGPRKSYSASDLSTPSHGHTRNRSSTLGKEAVLRSAMKKSSSRSEEAIGDSEANGEGRARGKATSFVTAKSDVGTTDNAHDDEDEVGNPVEWIMITRSNPGGSVPRFMVERGTPSAIVLDASKFLNWACKKDMEDFESDNDVPDDDDTNETAKKHHTYNHENDIHNHQTNGHLAGIEEKTAIRARDPSASSQAEQSTTNGDGYVAMAMGVAGAAGAFVVSHSPAIISEHFANSSDSTSASAQPASLHRSSVSSISSVSSVDSFESALEYGPDALGELSRETRAETQQHRELQKLEEKKRKTDLKLIEAREREKERKLDDSVKEAELLRKAEEKHEKEAKKYDEKYKKVFDKLQAKKEKAEKKLEEKRKKATDKDEKTRLTRELEEVRAEAEVLKNEKGILQSQVAELQAENTALAARVERLGPQGESMLKEAREEVAKGGRLRSSSLKSFGHARSTSIKIGSSCDKSPEVVPPPS